MGQYVMAAMAAVKALGTIAQGQYAHDAARAEARQLEANANRTEALAQREAIERSREARLVASRAIAVAGASGAGVDDPTVANLIKGIEDQGEFNKLSALYDGKMKANTMLMEASMKREEGRQARKSAYLTAITDFGSSLYSEGLFPKGGGKGFSLQGIGVDPAKFSKRVRAGSDEAINYAIGLK